MNRAIKSLTYGIGGSVLGSAIGVGTALVLRPYLFERFGVNDYIKKLETGETSINWTLWPLDAPLHTYIPVGIAAGLIVVGTVAGCTIGTYLGNRNSRRNSHMKSA